MSLWLWCRLPATDPLRPLPSNHQGALGTALNKKKKKNANTSWDEGREKGLHVAVRIQRKAGRRWLPSRPGSITMMGGKVTTGPEGGQQGQQCPKGE